MTALHRYQSLRPGDPNALDSMGDVNVMDGNFAQAEQFYLQAAKMSPAFLNGADQYKAAYAHLLTGDVAGADALYGKYASAEAHRANWLWISGRRRQAFDLLSAGAPGLPSRDAQSLAYAQLALWSLLLDNSAAAGAMSQKALDLMTPASAPVVALARFLAAPPLSPEAWEARARQFFPEPGAESSRDLAISYAFLLSRQFAVAATALRRVYDHSATAPESGTGAALGWALAETGSLADAAPLLRLTPVPSANGPAPAMSLWFPQIFHARALVAQKQGKSEEARSSQALFEKLSQ
jgi:tetratricopeptide (TPR) repeat protein